MWETRQKKITRLIACYYLKSILFKVTVQAGKKFVLEVNYLFFYSTIVMSQGVT